MNINEDQTWNDTKGCEGDSGSSRGRSDIYFGSSSSELALFWLLPLSVSSGIIQIQKKREKNLKPDGAMDAKPWCLEPVLQALLSFF